MPGSTIASTPAQPRAVAQAEDGVHQRLAHPDPAGEGLDVEIGDHSDPATVAEHLGRRQAVADDDVVEAADDRERRGIAEAPAEGGPVVLDGLPDGPQDAAALADQLLTSLRGEHDHRIEIGGLGPPCVLPERRHSVGAWSWATRARMVLRPRPATS
jgi:hypothetical protein